MTPGYRNNRKLCNALNKDKLYNHSNHIQGLQVSINFAYSVTLVNISLSLTSLGSSTMFCTLLRIASQALGI